MKNVLYTVTMLITSLCGLVAQCPGPSPCIQGYEDPRFEQLEIGSLDGAGFDSGQTRTFTLSVVPGTLTQAANNDREFVQVFLDFDCDGVFEYEVRDDCRYKRNKGGCEVNLDITVPTVTAPATYRGRAFVSYSQAVSNACSDLWYGDIDDFTITVNPSCTVAATLSSSDGDYSICAGESITFTGGGGDEYEFYINDAVAQPRSGSPTLTTTALSDGDQVRVRAYRATDGGCDDLSPAMTIEVFDPAISVQPVDQTVLTGESTSFSVTASQANAYQWQVSRDGGSTFSDLSDGGPYSGTQTEILTVSPVVLDLQRSVFRVLVNNYSVSCTADLVSNPAVLYVGIDAAITNRRTTFRVSPSY